MQVFSAFVMIIVGVVVCLVMFLLEVAAHRCLGRPAPVAEERQTYQL